MIALLVMISLGLGVFSFLYHGALIIYDEIR